MAYNLKNEKIITKRIGELLEIDNKNPHHRANLKYNHIRLQMQDGTEKSLLFTDRQIKRAKKRAQKNPEDIPSHNSITTTCYNLFDNKIADVQQVKNTEKDKRECEKYNYITVSQNEKNINLLFTDKEMEVAKKRANKNPEDIVKVSWIRDILD